MRRQLVIAMLAVLVLTAYSEEDEIERTEDGFIMPGHALKPRQEEWKCKGCYRPHAKAPEKPWLHQDYLVSPARIIAEVRKLATWAGKSLDIGCGDGNCEMGRMCDNHLESLQDEQDSIVLHVDGDNNLLNHARDRWAKLNATKFLEIIATPLNVKKILKPLGGAPKDGSKLALDVLKIDIASWGGEQLKAMLKYTDPKIIFFFINADIPAPILFSRLYEKTKDACCVGKRAFDCPGKQDGFFGASLSYASHVLADTHTLIQLDFNQAIYLKHDLASELFPESPHDDIWWHVHAVKHYGKDWCQFTGMSLPQGAERPCAEWFSDAPVEKTIEKIRQFWKKDIHKPHILRAPVAFGSKEEL